MFRKIVLATDLVGSSHRHEDFTSDFACRVGATVYPTFAFKAPGGVYSFTHPSTKLVARMESNWKERLRALVQRMEKQGVKAEGRFQNGDAASSIKQVVGEETADLVITAKHQKNPLQGFLIGSQSEGIVREADCPVLVLPEEYELQTRRGPVLCGIDFSRRSREALAFAIRLCESFDLDLVLIHAVEYQSGPPDLELESSPLIADMKSSALAKLKEWAQVAGAPKETRFVVECGAAAELMLEYVAELGAGLVLLGKQGQIMHNGHGLGSTVGTVLRRAQAPVLVHQ